MEYIYNLFKKGEYKNAEHALNELKEKDLKAYYNLIRSLNLKFKKENINVFLFECFIKDFSCNEREKIVLTGFVPVDTKIKCNDCILKCTDNNIDINKELTYINIKCTNGTNQIGVYCACGRKLLNAKQLKTIQRRNNTSLSRWSDFVKKRDGRCIFCYSNENLHAHHIIPVSENKIYMYDINNGMTLCAECHKKIHRKMKGIEEPEGIYNTIKTDFTKRR